MTPSEKVTMAIEMAMKNRAKGLDALMGPHDGLAIFVTFSGDGQAEVDFKPQLRKSRVAIGDCKPV